MISLLLRALAIYFFISFIRSLFSAFKIRKFLKNAARESMGQGAQERHTSQKTTDKGHHDVVDAEFRVLKDEEANSES